MDSLKSRVAYLNGLIDGLDIKNDSKEGRVLLEMTGVLEAVAEKLEELENSQNDMDEYLEALSDDLIDVEDDFYGSDDDDDDDDDYSEYEDIDEDFVDILCPHCNETVYIDKSMFQNKPSMKCPNCHCDIVVDCDECNSEFDE